MTLRRDGTPQSLNLAASVLKRGACSDCGMELRLCNLSRHQRARHDPSYTPPSRTPTYRRVHRTQVWEMNADRRAYYGDNIGTLYVIHFSRPISDHAQHYMGWSSNLYGRLVAHRDGLGSALTREAKAQGITFALTWKGVGNRTSEASIKRNRRLAELCSLCRPVALAKKAEKMRQRRRVA